MSKLPGTKLLGRDLELRLAPTGAANSHSRRIQCDIPLGQSTRRNLWKAAVTGGIFHLRAPLEQQHSRLLVSTASPLSSTPQGSNS